jgi:type VI secretion system secreted protein VgrG
METARYHLYDADGNLETKDGQPQWCSSESSTSCRFIYDPERKILAAKVVVALVPKLLVRIDPATKKELRDSGGNYVVVNYQTYKNGANSKKPFEYWGLKAIDRDVKSVDASRYKSRIEATLNKGGYKLILNGCQKGAACGCRVSVKFDVDINVVNESDAGKLNANNTIFLFPSVDRADASHWGEVKYIINVLSEKEEVVDQVKAHEIGHLFNFPDEYYKEGGSAHKQYIKKDGDLDFDLGRKNENEKADITWQLDSGENLMGYGANRPSATTRPYYIEYIRRWFSEYTNKEWRVGV